MDGVAVPLLEFSDGQQVKLKARIYPSPSGGCEIRFHYRASPRWLPVATDGRLLVMRWGGGDGKKSRLPAAGFARVSTLEGGGWAPFRPEPAVIPCTRAMAKGVWFDTPGGLRAIVCEGADGNPAVYPLVEPARFYYRVLTKDELMPVFAQDSPDWRRLAWEPPRPPGYGEDEEEPRHEEGAA